MKEKLIQQLVTIETLCVEMRIDLEFNKDLYLLKVAENHLREAAYSVRVQIQQITPTTQPTLPGGYDILRE